ncbi:MAG: hypothetical protein KDJ65_28845 [Anaerolineae bacterium]|nr:hypothetical protein [Anaerolineae bacterium]
MKNIRIHIFALYGLVLLSLGLNFYLISELLRVQQQTQDFARKARPVLQETVADTITDLEEIKSSTIAFDIKIDNEFPLDLEFPINESLEVPINTVIPIQEEIDTTIIMPIFGVDVPVDITVPVEVDVPIDLDVPVEFNRTIPISTTVPIEMDFPVAIVVSETELAPYIDQISAALIRFEETADQFLQGME